MSGSGNMLFPTGMGEWQMANIQCQAKLKKSTLQRYLLQFNVQVSVWVSNLFRVQMLIKHLISQVPAGCPQVQITPGALPPAPRPAPLCSGQWLTWRHLGPRDNRLRSLNIVNNMIIMQHPILILIGVMSYLQEPCFLAPQSISMYYLHIRTSFK